MDAELQRNLDVLASDLDGPLRVFRDRMVEEVSIQIGRMQSLQGFLASEYRRVDGLHDLVRGLLRVAGHDVDGIPWAAVERIAREVVDGR